jgi:hypothetical protein
MIKMALEQELKKLDIKTILITTILSAFGFLVALTWRDAIQKTIDVLLPKGEGLLFTYLAAIVVTVIAVIATYILLQIQKRDIIPDKYENRIKNKLKGN